MSLSDWLVSLDSPDASIFWSLTLAATLLLWVICIVKYCVFVDFQFPDDIFRVVLSDFSVLVFVFSISKYTEDFPYFIAFGTAVVEYVLLSTLLLRCVTGMTCGACNPLALGLVSMNYLVFIAGSAFNFSRATWALWHTSATFHDLVPGHTPDLDTFWCLCAAVVSSGLVFCGYSQSRRGREAYQRVPTTSPRTKRCC